MHLHQTGAATTPSSSVLRFYSVGCSILIKKNKNKHRWSIILLFFVFPLNLLRVEKSKQGGRGTVRVGNGGGTRL